VKTFDFQTATDVTSAVSMLAGNPQAKLLGGGTNLVDLMKLGVETPGLVIDVNHLGLADVEVRDDGSLRIGASVRNSDLAAHPQVRQGFPVMSQALLAGASGQLRNMATTAGNLLQRTRCLYFQDVSKPCNKRIPQSGCPAQEGIHRNLAVLGGSTHCVATHPSDLAVALVALDAVAEVQGPDAARAVAVRDLHRLPGDTPHLEHNLGHDEVITGIVVPPLAAGARSHYRKVRDRASYAFAVVSVAAVLTVRDGTVADVRIGLGGVAPKPWRADTAEAILRGRPATAASFRAAVDAELAQATPLRDNAFKLDLVRQLVVRSLTDLTLNYPAED
jgi:xanthine dehydrogenase YagS FAD-binding subunit